MDDNDRCSEEEGGEIRSRRRAGQGRAIAGRGQYHTVGQNPISWLGRGQEWSVDPVCLGWPLRAVASWVGAAASCGSGESTVIRALWTRH